MFFILGAAKVVKQASFTVYCREWPRLSNIRCVPLIVSDAGRSNYTTSHREWHGLFDVFRWKAMVLRWNMMAYDNLSFRCMASKHRPKLGAFVGFARVM